ncbi:MAG: hypothetical protein ABIG42_03645, partial [bacterium]
MRLSFIWLLVAGLIIAGCSGGGAVMPNHDLSDASDNSGTIGLLGAYELSIDTVNQTAELVQKRSSAIGESYLVSGLNYFITSPCADCFGLNTISFVSGNLVLNFGLDHPFPAGNPGAPPSALNRNDLNVFDVALVIAPQGATATTFALATKSIYDGLVANAAGYTTELANMVTDTAAMPFVLVIDDSLGTASTFNKFAMGVTGVTFDVEFSLALGASLDFDTYLTFGYGWSAAKANRLTPKYYNPEFNRKNAWKVAVTVPVSGSTWVNGDTTTTYPVLVDVYDWQQGATVATAPDFGDAAITEVFSASEVASVTLEIAGMNTAISTPTGAATGTGAWDDPLVYTFDIANENDLVAGTYGGLVIVTDERVPAATAPDL